MENPLELQWTVINGVKIYARRFYLERLIAAHNELVLANIGVAGKLGFLPSGGVTASWRSLTTQRQLLNRGASRTLASHHRRGIAIDCYPSRPYTERIKPIMAKHGLVNDLAPWDALHWNYLSNSEGFNYSFIDELPAFVKQFSMDQFDNTVINLTEKNVTDSGAFALVYGGKKHHVRAPRAGFASLTVLQRGMRARDMSKAEWDSIPSGDDF